MTVVFEMTSRNKVTDLIRTGLTGGNVSLGRRRIAFDFKIQ